MVENFTDFYDTLFEFSANIAYRIKGKEHIQGYCTGGIYVLSERRGQTGLF